MHDLGLKTSIQKLDAFVRYTLMGNQPWPQFQNGIRRSRHYQGTCRHEFYRVESYGIKAREF